MVPHVQLQTSPLKANELREAVREPVSGAIVIFEGCARDNNMGKAVTGLFFEAYEPMALTQLENIRGEAVEKFSLNACLIHHRLGNVPLAEAAVIIVCASAHRAESLEATAWLLAQLKEKVPIWKREHYEGSEASWVEGESRYC